MSLYLLMKLLHVLAAFWLIAGVVGRDFAFWQAGRATSVQAVQGLLHLSDFFRTQSRYSGLGAGVDLWPDRHMVQKWPLFGFLQGAASNRLLVSSILFIDISAVIAPLRLIDRRRQRTKAIDEAIVLGAITPALTAALHDKVVNRFRMTELILLLVIIMLMVTKPF